MSEYLPYIIGGVVVIALLIWIGRKRGWKFPDIDFPDIDFS